MSALLTVSDLQVSYGKVSALRGANITVSAGEIATVIGPNGAGKSTMLNALMGLLPYAGRVELSGRPIDHLLIETSGVALPASIAQSLGLIAGLDLNGIIGLADAETVLAALDRDGEVTAR